MNLYVLLLQSVYKTELRAVLNINNLVDCIVKGTSVTFIQQANAFVNN